MKGIIWFCNKIPNKKQEGATDILAWKVSIILMANKEIDQLLTISIEKGLINNEKGITMTYVMHIIVEKRSVTHYHCRMVMEKKSS